MYQKAMNILPDYVFSTVLVLLYMQQATSSQVVIGAIIDGTSRAGKEANVSLQMTLDDISKQTNQSVILHITNSHWKPALAALSVNLYNLS